MAFVYFCVLLCLTQLFFILPSYSQGDTITLNLTPIPRPHSSSFEPKDVISDIATTTLQRAYHLKHGKQHPSVFNSATPLFPKSSGAYSVSLSLGTPAQNIPALFDTGSSLVWVPCTSRYSCSNCTTGTNKTPITTYKPKKSSSKTHIGCLNQKCKWLDQPGAMASCFGCNRSSSGSCSMPCFYTQVYGAGDTSGVAASDNLNFANNKIVRGFLFGCSQLSDQMPEGIVGFGRSQSSLPSQLKLEKFSYCLVSHKFDDKAKSSNLILGNAGEVPGIKYTPLIRNPQQLSFNQYYYVHVEMITVNGKAVKIPRRVLLPDSNGSGGSIVDSGSTLTSMVPSVFDPVVNEFVAQLPQAHRKQALFAHSSLGNLLCVNVTGERRVSMPDLVFHFKGGATMDLPVGNYLNGGNNLLCLPFVNATFAVGLTGTGPAVIIGNYQQQNHHLEYDLKNERLGLKKHWCG